MISFNKRDYVCKKALCGDIYIHITITLEVEVEEEEVAWLQMEEVVVKVFHHLDLMVGMAPENYKPSNQDPNE